ncbi:hypothetical protein GCM10011383_36670 [Hymenobacter cavernae]|uniref:HTH araC/xylS-type domain-containing protein n=2 Tax=Hymenobacter cavernae TaxID=2044852 RepID=A0ABQ1UL48_9BACT|nr:hypothetical protein GCM10011383_36670 [Hymenobacter cavernae]
MVTAPVGAAATKRVGTAVLTEPDTAPETDPELWRWTEDLLDHMRTARPYLAPELTLGELAAQLRTNTSRLSRTKFCS